MKVALTAWEDKISPVFDSARRLLIAEIKNAEIISSRYELFNPEMTHSLADSLCNLGVEVLICGAISETPAKIIEASGINLIPFIGGMLEEVLISYAKENSIKPIFLMPGCGGKRNRIKNCNIFSKQQKEVKTMPRGDGTGPQGQGTGAGRGEGGCQPKKDGKGSGRRTGRGTGRGQGKGGGKGSGQGRGGQN